MEAAEQMDAVIGLAPVNKWDSPLSSWSKPISTCSTCRRLNRCIRLCNSIPPQHASAYISTILMQICLISTRIISIFVDFLSRVCNWITVHLKPADFYNRFISLKTLLYVYGKSTSTINSWQLIIFITNQYEGIQGLENNSAMSLAVLCLRNTEGPTVPSWHLQKTELN